MTAAWQHENRETVIQVRHAQWLYIPNNAMLTRFQALIDKFSANTCSLQRVLEQKVDFFSLINKQVNKVAVTLTFLKYFFIVQHGKTMNPYPWRSEEHTS